MGFRAFRYRFQQFIARGGISIFTSLFAVFIAAFVASLILRVAMDFLFGDGFHDGFYDNLWATWTQLTDPGNMYYDLDSGWVTRLVSIVTGMVGIIIFSALIAFITTAVDELIRAFRRGDGEVIEAGHTLVLGWSGQVPELARELILANESESRATLVILAEHDKEDMDSRLSKSIRNRKTTKIVTSPGSTTSIDELRRVAVRDARSVIILSDAKATDDKDTMIRADIKVIKTVMAVLASREGGESIPLIAQIHTEEKRKIINSFGDSNIIALDVAHVMTQLITQTSLTSGLQVVYSEMFSFDGGEIYFVEADEMQGRAFYEVARHMPDGVPMGIWSEQVGVQLRPEANHVMAEGEELVVFAQDDSSIRFDSEPVARFETFATPEGPQAKKKQHALILGWSVMGRRFIEEDSEYLADGSRFSVVVPRRIPGLEAELASLQESCPEHTIELIETNALAQEALAEIKPFDKDVVLLLNPDPAEADAETTDATVLVVLHLLRRIAQEQGLDGSKTRIVTQVLNPENQELMIQSHADDFVISDRLATMLMAQMSEEPRMRAVYDDLFQEGGSEIYIKPAWLYLGGRARHKATFAEILATVQARNEICLGYRLAAQVDAADANFGVTLNPPKDAEIELSPDDFLVVLSEDEL